MALMRAHNQSIPPSRNVADYGRYIFAYCHVRTNQVVYSLHRELKDRVLRHQLPDLGANNKPPRVRRDEWKPLWTLIFPESSNGYNQGLDAFRRLREWRYMHEHHTPKPSDDAVPRTEEQREEIQKKLDERGGSKKETVWDIIKREKKRARIRLIMDQKANSVADLAAVLLEQDKARKELLSYRSEVARPAEVQEMVGMATDGEELLKQIDAKKQRYEAIIAKPADQVKPDNNKSKKGAARMISDLRRRTTATRFAIEAVKEARVRLYHQEMIKTGARDAAAAEAKQQDTTAAQPNLSVTYDDEHITWIDKPWQDFLDDPAALEYGGFPKTPEENVKLASQLEPFLPSFPTIAYAPGMEPKKGLQHDRLKEKSLQPYSLENVCVRWQNLYDAEYAALWPSQVQHDALGITGSMAPHPAAPALMDTIDWANRAKYNKQFKLLDNGEDAGSLIRLQKNETGIYKIIDSEHGEEDLVEAGGAGQEARSIGLAERTIAAREKPKDNRSLFDRISSFGKKQDPKSLGL